MRARLTCTARVKNVPARGAFFQGLTLLHFSAQPKPSSHHSVSHHSVSLYLMDWGEIMHSTYPTE